MSYEYETQGMNDQLKDSDVARPSSLPTNDIMDQFDEEQSEDDNEIELELTVEYMANGHSDMESEDLVAAEENFRSALELAEEHDFSKKLDYGPRDITLILADCLARQDKEEEALEVLEPVADGSFGMRHSDTMPVRAGSVRDSSRDQVTQFKACHTMGAIFLKRADTQAAEKRAQQAFKGRRKVCGAHDSATLESVQLLIDIYTANNDKTKARAYRRFLEPSAKTRASIGGDTSAKVSAEPSEQTPALQPMAAAATLTSPFPGTPGQTNAVTIPSVAPTPLETNRTSSSLSQATQSATTSASPQVTLSSAGPLARIVEAESLLTAPTLARAELEHPASPLSDSIRAAVQTAATSSTLPASPAFLAAEPADSVLPHASSPVQVLNPGRILQPAPILMPAPSAGNVFEPGVDTTPAVSAVMPAPLAISARKPVANHPYPALLSIKAQSPERNGSPSVSTVIPKHLLVAPELTATIPIQEPTTAPPLPPTEVSPSATNVLPPAATTASVLHLANDAQSAARISSPTTASLYASSSVKTSSSGVSAPSPSRIKLHMLPPDDVTPSTTSVHPLVTTATPMLPPITISQHASEISTVPATTLDVVSPVEMSTSTDDTPLPAPTAVTATHPAPPARSTPSPPSASLSASQAALASIFAESGGKPAKKSPPLASTGSSTTLPSKNADAVTTSALPVRQPSPAKESLTPAALASPVPTSQRTAEIPLTDEVSQQEETSAPSRTFSWLTDAKLTAPSSIARGSSSQASAPEAVAPLSSDTTSANLGTTATTKRKIWSVPFSRSKTDGNMKKSTALPPPIPGSAASVYISPRNPSLTTMESTAEPKRHMSLAGSIGSQPTSFFDKEVGEKSPRASISRSHTSSQATSRVRLDLAPKFASIKTLRAEGKKSASIDAAMKLLREYDPEKKILVIREAELKKNMKESHKGLASTGYGYAPIHLFCDRKIEAAAEIELLIEQGVDVNAVACKAGMPGHEPFTPLQRAIEHGHAEIVRLLVESDAAIAPPRPQKGAPNLPVETVNHPLLLACTKGHTEITYTLLHAGAAKMVKEFPSRQWHGNSLLHEACWQADTSMVKMLLDHLKAVKSQYYSSSGPDFESGVIGAPGQQDRFGATPIMYAIDLRDCTSQRMRERKSARRKECVRLLLEHDIHGDLHSQQYRDNIARVLSTKWTRGPGKGHSIFCYCDEAGNEELTRLLDPFRYQVSPNMRCHATPQCTTLSGSSIRSGSVKSSSTDRPSKLPDFPELMSAPVAWPSSPTGTGTHFELPGVVGSYPAGLDNATARITGTSVGHDEASTGPITMMSHGNGNRDGIIGGLSELASETSQRSK